MTPNGSLRAWAQAFVDAEPVAGLGDPVVAVALVADRVAEGLGVERSWFGPEFVDLIEATGPVIGVPGGEGGSVDDHHLSVVEPPGGWANPWLLGLVHEQAAAPDERKGRGAWYTPESVVRGLVELALPADSLDVLPPVVVDPTCGGGAFLLACADQMLGAGFEPVDVLASLAGMDLDPGAVMVTRWSLLAWAGRVGLQTVDRDALWGRIESGDALIQPPGRWGSRCVVVGNPPFATPLRSGVIPESAIAFRSRHNHLLGPYADLAAIHLTKAVLDAGPGSIVALVQPQSVLSSQDTAGLRSLIRRSLETVPADTVGRSGPGYRLEALWVAREMLFDAGVKACAPIITVGPVDSGGAEVRLATGAGADLTGVSRELNWGQLAATTLGGPPLPGWLSDPKTERLGSLCTATAGFRDEYYGLVAACREADPVGSETDDGGHPALVTVGLIDPLENLWGQQLCKFGGRSWQRPTIDPSLLDAKVANWVQRQSRPKVIVATQSKILEPVVDWDGSVVPATPLIAVHGEADRLGHLAAVLLAPPVVAWAWGRWFGSALTVDGLKLAARQVLELPLPVDEQRWDRAARLIEDHHRTEDQTTEVVAEVARIMNEAYQAPEAALEWWRKRAIKSRRSARRLR